MSSLPAVAPEETETVPPPAAAGPLSTLSEAERRIILAFAEAAIPPVRGLSISTTHVQHKWLSKFEDLLARMPREQRRGIRSLLRLIEYSPLIFSLRPARFSRLPLEERERQLQGWEGSHWLVRRLLLLALKAIVAMCYTSVEEVAASLGYARDCLSHHRSDLPRT
ncbi:MAG: hypothetical protein HYY13_09210 [Nitrospirae bacterium]|nr:hypothetical protein [Nitrospirota bacterium]